MAHLDGQTVPGTDSGTISDQSTVGGPTVKDSLDALDVADGTALHKAVSGEFAAMTAKAAPVLADIPVIESSTDANAKRRTTVGGILAAAGQVTNLPAATILGTDKIAFEDASDTLAMKEATVQQLFEAPGLVDGLPLKVPIGADTILVNDSAAGGAAKKAPLNTIPITQAQVVHVPVAVASDGAAAITATTNALLLAETTTGTKVITFSGAYPGQTVPIRLEAASGGEYTFPVQGGTLTIDAADQEPLVVRNAANDAWLVLRKGGATIVP